MRTIHVVTLVAVAAAVGVAAPARAQITDDEGVVVQPVAPDAGEEVERELDDLAASRVKLGDRTIALDRAATGRR